MARMQWPAVIKLQGLTHRRVFLGARVPAMHGQIRVRAVFPLGWTRRHRGDD